jgi:protoporphyrinogen oxidase
MDGLILGAGVTGLAAGIATGFEVLEAADVPGGICSSYYVRPGATEHLAARPKDGDAYRFERGGGHWIFGGDTAVLRLIESLAPTRRYHRRSSVYFGENPLYVPYPLQNHLRHLGPDVAARALAEMARPGPPGATLKEWLASAFGPTLCELFFFPFNELYTASLYDRIAPQDDYKSPLDLVSVIRGALAEAPSAGYNITFAYPEAGLDFLARQMADRCRIRYGSRVVGIDHQAREVRLYDGRVLHYDVLISTLPLNQSLEMAGLRTQAQTDPHTSVLVLNLGARRGPRCPEDHWIYVRRSSAGFHRVGFYGNVDPSFLPSGSPGERTALYVERAFAGAAKPAADVVRAYQTDVVRELRDWGFIDEVEVVDPTWIEVAYTWSWPGSSWRREAASILAGAGIHAVGRYGRWVFQGIADSIRDGLVTGAAIRASHA